MYLNMGNPITFEDEIKSRTKTQDVFKQNQQEELLKLMPSRTKTQDVFKYVELDPAFELTSSRTKTQDVFKWIYEVK